MSYAVASSPDPTHRLSLADCVQLACLLEATAPKPGNVHRGADFLDLTYPDLLLAGQAIAPILAATKPSHVGRTILQAVTASRHMVNTNANLGIVSLLAPLCAVPRNLELQVAIGDVLRQLQPIDAEQVYAAIRLARPGGMGSQPRMTSTVPRRRIYSTQCELLRRTTATPGNMPKTLAMFLKLWCRCCKRIFNATPRSPPSHTHLWSCLRAGQIRSSRGNAARKSLSKRATERAKSSRAVERSNDVERGNDKETADEQWHEELTEFDFWLHFAGQRRNPGTTADLICAGLFVGLRDGWLGPPFVWR